MEKHLIFFTILLLLYPILIFAEGSTVDYHHYINDPSSFQPIWSELWQPEDWMLDFDSKISSLCAEHPNRLFTIAHRGDTLHYPENSIEGIISTWLMGGDCVEVDVRFTKDGIPVLMHDETLDRTTNFSDLRGKNGLPNNKYLFQWTYEQLSHLNLKEGMGGANAAVTPYKIPTLEEVLLICKNRLFIILDKPNCWRYCDIEGIMPESAAKFIYPYMEKTGNYSSVLICFGTTDAKRTATTLSAKQALEIQKYIFDNSGEKTYIYLRGYTGTGSASTYAEELLQNSLSNAAILINGEFDPLQTGKIAKVSQVIKTHPQNMFGAWTLEATSDRPEIWEQMYQIGLRSIMTNDILSLLRFSQSKMHESTP